MSRMNIISKNLECKIVSNVQKSRTKARDYFWQFWTFFGFPYIWIGIGIILFFLDFLLLFVLFFFAGVSYFLTIFPLKIATKRKRPEKKCEDVKLLVKARSFSFPSGHTYTATIFGLVLAIYFNSLPLLICMLALGVMVAVSRIYLGSHFLSDVLIAYVLAIVVVVIIFTILYPIVQTFFLLIQRLF